MREDPAPRYHDRLGDPTLRPPGAKLVEMLYFSFPSSIGKPEPARSADQPAAPGDEG